VISAKTKGKATMQPKSHTKATHKATARATIEE